jgi:tripartite-type tricarboxylate transporter receptor subunit TctC
MPVHLSVMNSRSSTYTMVRHLLCSALACLLPLSVTAQAQAWPNKSIRIIIPAAPGDSCDVLTRLVAPRLTERLGQAVVVENRAGSGGQLGLTLIKQAVPDGYTLGCGQGGNMVIVPISYQKVAYDSQKDFAPVALMASNFLALVVNPNVPFKTTADLINHAKANPGKVSFGSTGEGAFIHFATELFRMQAGFTYLHVPYKSSALVTTEILGGQIDATLGSYISLQPLVASGKLRMLGIARASRLPAFPSVPTLGETVPGFVSGGWFGIIAPAGTPKEIVALLNREVNAAMMQPNVREQMNTLGLETHTEPPEFFNETIRSDFARWGKLARDIGFKPL